MTKIQTTIELEFGMKKWMILAVGLGLLAIVIGSFVVRRGVSAIQENLKQVDKETGLYVVSGQEYRDAWLIDLIPGQSQDSASIARRERLEREWRAATSMNADASVEALVEGWRSSVRDQGNAINAQLVDELLSALARHARARASRSPTQYLNLVNESQDLGWSDVESILDFSGMPGALQFAELDVPASTTPQELLAWLWGELFDKFDHVIARVGVGEDGAVIQVVRERILESELASLGFSGKYSIDREKWRGQILSTALRFQRPIQSTKEYLESHSSVTVAYAHVIVELADGRIGTWISEWYFNEDTARWVCEDMSLTSHKAMYMVY